jgi:hypothetical protein
LSTWPINNLPINSSRLCTSKRAYTSVAVVVSRIPAHAQALRDTGERMAAGRGSDAIVFNVKGAATLRSTLPAIINSGAFANDLSAQENNGGGVLNNGAGA